MKSRPVVVTRPGEPGARLARDLVAAGMEALWLPAFILGPPPDEARVAAVLAHLPTYQLAIFVSAAAVEATAQRLTAPWPAGTAIGVVGGGTRRAVVEHIPSAAGVTWFAPDAATEGEGGSEALWHVLSGALSQIRRVLILRAQHGREWLGEQLEQAGVLVDTLAVYARLPAEVGAPEAAQVQRWLADNRTAVLLVTSSEAVDALAAQVEPVTGRAWLLRSRVLASHERIVTRLRAAGFADVRFTSLDVDSIRKAAFAQ